MKNEQVWLVLVKARPLDNCDISFDGSEYHFADVYIPLAKDVTGVSAISSVIEQVKQLVARHDQHELAEILICMRFLPDQWHDQTESTKSMHNLAALAVDQGKPIFSGFRSEGIQDSYRYHFSVS